MQMAKSMQTTLGILGIIANIAVYSYILGAMISLPTVVYYIRIGATSYAIYMILLGMLVASIIACILGARNKVFKLLKFFLAEIVLLLSLIFLNGQIRFGLALPIDSLAPIAQTNVSETLEFISANKDTVILGIAGFSVISFLIWWLIAKEVKGLKLAKGLVIAFLVTFIISSVLIARNPAVLDDFLMCNDVSVVLENSVDLRQYPTNPQIIETTKDHPQSIVLVIGESFTKYHSSLYGYEKKTNPCLQRYVDEGSVVVFDSVESPCVSTTPTFKYLLNTYTRKSKGKWYESTTIQEYFHKAGYHLTWISNQQQYGAFNNISSGQSLLCDERFFHGGEGQSMDMSVVDSYKLLEKVYSHNLFFFHLYGQHPEFDKRYPATFSRFKPDDYDVPRNQKNILAAYDNATLYNDSVVAAIISCFKDEDALVIYLADHGLDLFYTDSDYAAHGKPTNPESDKLARQIPFMIYVSESFRQNHSELASRIIAAKAIPFCTELLIYKLLNFTGYKIDIT